MLRHLAGVSKVTLVMRAWHDDDSLEMDVHVDVDWAMMTMMMMSGIVVEHWKRRALSVAESEYDAHVTGTAEGLEMQLLLSDRGRKAEVRKEADCNAAKATVSRRGLGKTRHIELRYLWCRREQFGKSEHQESAQSSIWWIIDAREGFA